MAYLIEEFIAEPFARKSWRAVKVYTREAVAERVAMMLRQSAKSSLIRVRAVVRS